MVVESVRHRRAGRSSKTTAVRLARVVRTPSAASTASAVLIELEGARIAVGSAASAETLRVVFEALRGRRAP